MKYPITVIVLVYRVEEYISKSVHSLFNQTINTQLEYIFINDSTPDQSMEILNSIIQNEYSFLSNNIKILNNTTNKGTAYCRNLGIANASGTYVIFCDSDDWIDLNMYQLLYETAEKTKSDIVLCDYWKEFKKKKLYNQLNFSRDKKNLIKNTLSGATTSYIWNQLVLKKLYAENKIQFPSGISMWEDLAVDIELYYYAQKISYIRKALYHYNQDNIFSVVHSINDKQFKDMLKACKMIGDFLRLKSIYSIFKLSFLKRVFFAKKCLLTNSHLRNYTLWEEIYPEANKYIDNYNLRFYHRLGYKLARQGKFKCAIIILKMSDKIDSIIKQSIIYRYLRKK